MQFFSVCLDTLTRLTGKHAKSKALRCMYPARAVSTCFPRVFKLKLGILTGCGNYVGKISYQAHTSCKRFLHCLPINELDLVPMRIFQLLLTKHKHEIKIVCNMRENYSRTSVGKKFECMYCYRDCWDSVKSWCYLTTQWILFRKKKADKIKTKQILLVSEPNIICGRPIKLVTLPDVPRIRSVSIVITVKSEMV